MYIPNKQSCNNVYKTLYVLIDSVIYLNEHKYVKTRNIYTGKEHILSLNPEAYEFYKELIED